MRTAYKGDIEDVTGIVSVSVETGNSQFLGLQSSTIRRKIRTGHCLAVNADSECSILVDKVLDLNIQIESSLVASSLVIVANST